jgi:hypothetical protein
MQSSSLGITHKLLSFMIRTNKKSKATGGTRQSKMFEMKEQK